MRIERGTLYHLTLKFPWGEVRRFECAEVWREEDGTVRWDAETSSGLEPFLDCAFEETEAWVVGWLGGTCDALAAVSNIEGKPEL